MKTLKDFTLMELKAIREYLKTRKELLELEGVAYDISKSYEENLVKSGAYNLVKESLTTLDIFINKNT